MTEAIRDIEAILNKGKRRKFLNNVYFPIVVLLTLSFLIIAFIVEGFQNLFPIAIFFYLIFWFIGLIFSPSLDSAEKIAFHLKAALIYIDDIKKAKKEIASAIKELEEFSYQLKAFPFTETTLEPLSKLAENIRQRIYPALDDPMAKNSVSYTLDLFLMGNIDRINLINAELEKLDKWDERQVLFYETPKLHTIIYKASKEATIRFWHKSSYSRFFVTLIIFLGGYCIPVYLFSWQIEASIIGAIIMASALLSHASKTS